MTAATSAPRLVVRVTPTNELITSGDSVEAVSCTFPWSWWPHREYIIQVRSSKNDGQEAEICQTQLRFSEFCSRFSTGYFLDMPSALLPTRGWGLLSNYTTNETNVQRRSKAIRDYLSWVLNHTGAPTVEVCRALEISEQGQATLREIVKLQQQEVKREEEERREQQRKAHALERSRWEQAYALERSHWEQAQALTVSGEAQSRCSLRFPASREFEMHTRWFSFGGDANIRSGPRSRAWFCLERTDFPQILPFSDITYELRTAQGKPLLEMKERFRMWDYMCDLYYITSSGARVHAAKVHRELQFAFLEETYTITTAKAVNGRFLCTGGWWDLCIKVNGGIVAKVQRHLFSMTDGYTLKIFPNQDCILLLGICCAIGRIHAAINSRNS